MTYSPNPAVPEPDIQPPALEPPARAFEDLTLGEALGMLFRHPAQTVSAFRQSVLALPEDRISVPVALRSGAAFEAESGPAMSEWFAALVQNVRYLAMPLSMAALAILGIGISLVLTAPEYRVPDVFPGPAFVLLAVGLAFGVLINLTIHFPRLTPFRRKVIMPDAENPGGPGFFDWLNTGVLIFGLSTAAIIMGVGAREMNKDNTFTLTGLIAWFASIILWWLAGMWPIRPFGGLRRTGQRVVQWLSGPIRLRWSWTAAALIVILLVGASFRLGNLSAYPPDMTSDHVEKLLDASFIAQGLTPVFLPNNGGREATQMYLLAAMHNVFGLPLNFDLLKLLSGLEGLLTILVAYWMGRAIIGEEDRALGNLTGVIMAAMIATSYWHTMLSRLGLRIVLTPLGVMFVVIFLARAMRHNRRIDWLATGLSLGISLYFYQAIRMVPVLVVAGALLALLIRARSWRSLGSYVLNGMFMVVMSLAVFAPLGRYWSDYPQYFWQRTEGRLLGEEVVDVRNANGEVIGQRATTLEERLNAFAQNLPVLSDNLRRSILMFNVKGDLAWITGDPDGTPQLDPITGTFFVMGLGVMFIRGVWRRDPVDWLLIVGIFIMLLPTALSIAFVIEVPSATRASGSLPMVYLLAAFGLAALLKAFADRLTTRRGIMLVLTGGVLLVGFSASRNWDAYFVDAMSDYRNSTFPYHQAGTLMKNFTVSTGAAGNSFMVSWPYWWDHRALGLEAGYPDWNNGVLRERMLAEILAKLTMSVGTKYEIQPNRQMLFFLNAQDVESLEALRAAFPGGSDLLVESFRPDRNFVIYVSPPVGCQWVRETLEKIPAACAE